MANILLVDDEEQLRSVLTIVLESEGHVVREAQDGDEALESYSRQPADLVITDLLMPGKEGIETIMELRQSYPEVKIIAMSGRINSGRESNLEAAKLLGADYILAKPFSNRDIVNAVDKILEK
jgi:CheY-like chemotaxis protein